jgi:hypothetical protein
MEIHLSPLFTYKTKQETAVKNSRGASESEGVYFHHFPHKTVHFQLPPTYHNRSAGLIAKNGRSRARDQNGNKQRRI